MPRPTAGRARTRSIHASTRGCDGTSTLLHFHPRTTDRRGVGDREPLAADERGVPEHRVEGHDQSACLVAEALERMGPGFGRHLIEIARVAELVAEHRPDVRGLPPNPGQHVPACLAVG